MNFQDEIIKWYEVSQRDLPWRQTNDPYRIWVSEIILQQTRVEQGLAYYHRFLESFPDLNTLADAGEEKIMKIWQGLGYYSRARNMRHAACTLKEDYGSQFPSDYKELIKLKGIGDYSASAIASIAFGGVHPVIDGNVLRVVSRFAGIETPVDSVSGLKLVREFMSANIDRNRPGVFNQAVMELGALVCQPRKPACHQCPLSAGCVAFQTGKALLLPVKAKSIKTSRRYFNYFLIAGSEGHDPPVWFLKRTNRDIWKNLYDLPLIETETAMSPAALFNSDHWKNFSDGFHFTRPVLLDALKYNLTHRELMVHFYLATSADFYQQNGFQIPFSSFPNYPVSRLLQNFLQKIALKPGIFFKNPDKGSESYFY